MRNFTYHVDQINEVVNSLLDDYSEEKVWILNGETGSGKTTLIKSVCLKLGVVDEMSSPSFSIVNEYANEQGLPVFHFDFYRLENVEEAIAIGVEDYFFSGNECFIEWPNLIKRLLPDQYLEININSVGHNVRQIITTLNGSTC